MAEEAEVAVVEAGAAVAVAGEDAVVEAVVAAADAVIRSHPKIRQQYRSSTLDTKSV
jgi:hypothetical protein